VISRRVRLRNNSLPGEKENASGLILDIKVFRVLDQPIAELRPAQRPLSLPV